MNQQTQKPAGEPKADAGKTQASSGGKSPGERANEEQREQSRKRLEGSQE